MVPLSAATVTTSLCRKPGRRFRSTENTADSPDWCMETAPSGELVWL